MIIDAKSPLNVGLIGLGRLGRVYARDLARGISETKLVAVADTAHGIAEGIAAEHNVRRWYVDPADLLADPDVDAVVVVSPTHTHCSLVVAALERGKPTFCEKPPALSLEEALVMKAASARSAIPLYIGFMRRFDTGYAAAKRQIEDGAIGQPVVFKSSSRDPFPPSLEYANPKSSGGLMVDMGIHDFDLARWFMGEIETVHAMGGTLAYPELKTVGDLDNAVVSLRYSDGRLGLVDLSRNGVYGYDITTEILGTAGTLRIGYLRETPLLIMTANQVAHDTVPYFMQRFERAYTAQLRDFATAVLEDRVPSVTIDDGVEALRIGLAATRSYQTARPIDVSDVVTSGAAAG
jgi:scyllo-inositol 2-dehydrogenase (NAD+)